MADENHFYPHAGPVHEYMASERPELLRLYNDLAAAALEHRPRSDGVELPPQYRELIVLGILAFRGTSTESLVSHIERALELGASRREVLDAFEATLVPGGAPTMLNGFRALMSMDRPSDS